MTKNKGNIMGNHMPEGEGRREGEGTVHSSDSGLDAGPRKPKNARYRYYALKNYPSPWTRWLHPGPDPDVRPKAERHPFGSIQTPESPHAARAAPQARGLPGDLRRFHHRAEDVFPSHR